MKTLEHNNTIYNRYFIILCHSLHCSDCWWKIWNNVSRLLRSCECLGDYTNCGQKCEETM